MFRVKKFPYSDRNNYEMSQVFGYHLRLISMLRDCGYDWFELRRFGDWFPCKQFSLKVRNVRCSIEKRINNNSCKL
jgi:hypothetical protein